MDKSKIVKMLSDFNELVMFKHSIFSLPFIFIAMIISSHIQYQTIWFGWKLLLLGLLAAIGARNFAMGFNRLVDVDIDRCNPRTSSRPSVDGRISKNKMLIFVIINALLFVVVTFFINNLAFILSFPFLIILALYSYFKRFSEFAHLFLGLSLALAPIAGSIAILQSVPMWTILLSCGVMFWVAGFDLLYSLQDIEFDKQNALCSIPSKYGSDATLFISLLFHSITILFWILFAIESNSGIFTYIAIIISALILAKEQQIVRRDFTKIDRAFFTLNGYLGIFLFFMIVVDRMML